MRKTAAAALVGVALVLGACGAGSEEPPPLDPAMVARGREVYAQYCSACHGPEGEGAPGWKERNELGELPPPPHGPEGHTWMHSDSMLYHLVREGWRDPFNKTDRLTMPAFRGVLSPMEVRAVITYLKTLWTEEQRRFQWRESRDEPFPESTS